MAGIRVWLARGTASSHKDAWGFPATIVPGSRRDRRAWGWPGDQAGSVAGRAGRQAGRRAIGFRSELARDGMESGSPTRTPTAPPRRPDPGKALLAARRPFDSIAPGPCQLIESDERFIEEELDRQLWIFFLF